MGGHCSDHTLPTVTTVYAKPIFAAGNTYPEQLPLEALYSHRDYVDLISAQEFGLEALFPGQTLLCVAVAARAEALDEMEALILDFVTPCRPIAVAQAQDDHICVNISGHDFAFSNKDAASDLRNALLESNAPKPAWLAVLVAWCTDYRVVLYGTEGLL